MIPGQPPETPQPAGPGELRGPAAGSAARYPRHWLHADESRHVRLAAALIMAGFVVLGLGQAFVWSRVAPGIETKVFADGSYGALPTANYHSFAAVAIFVLAGAAIGIVGAVAVWRIRAVRGSVTLVAVAVGCALGATAAYLLGPLWASGAGPGQLAATGADHLVTVAPTLPTPLVLLAQPLVATVTYTFLVAWDGRADLGRKRATQIRSSTEAGSVWQ